MAHGETSSISASESLQQLAAADKAAGYQPAIEIADPTGFINASSTFTLSNLIGKKVILLDFWTYSCINCIRTIPYLNAWYQKYASSGLEIVGIHTPEFDFEKDINNVRAAVASDGIQYPVILDSNYGTWDAYNNLYWPHEYLIDLAGYIVHNQIGEGGYADTEAQIQNALAERARILGAAADGGVMDGNSVSMMIPTSTVNIAPANLNEIQSSETYFDSQRNSTLANGTQGVGGVQTFTLPSGGVTLNELYLGGTWDIENQYATNVSTGAKVEFKYNAGKVYFVVSGAATGTTVEVLQDGVPIPAADAGSDVQNGKMIITGSRLYNLINNHDGGGEHTLELIVDSPGLEAYTFTFG
jgi:thiol-disulfide isomerase/thioredoxin